MARRIIVVAASLCTIAASLTPSSAQTPADGRIVSVVYQMGPKAIWGFHLGHMKDGRFCVRFGPGRLTLALIERAPDICFDKLPGTVERTAERTSRVGDASQQGKLITVSTYRKGSIEMSGNAVTLEIATCSKAECMADHSCLLHRYVVRMSGQECSAEVTLPRGKPTSTTCEHHEAR